MYQRVLTGNMRMASLMAMAAGLAAGVRAAPSVFNMPAPKRVRRNYPMPVISFPEEIAAWNRNVDEAKHEKNERKAARRHYRQLHKALKDNGQHPTFPKARAHKQHTHPLCDERGAYTLVGREYFPDGTQRRRIWLAGISAQRGY